MLRSIIRKVVSVELTSSIPPKLIIPFDNFTREFIIQSDKKLSDLFSEIKREEPSVKSIEAFINETPVPDMTSLGSLTKQEFTLKINKKEIHILPGLALFIRGNESYYSKCHQLGVPFNEARAIARFLESLGTQLPDEFDKDTLEKAIVKAKEASSTFGPEEVAILTSQLEGFKKALVPLEAERDSIQQQSELYADRILQLGLGVLLTQWTGIAYGTFVLYGWDVMEPFSYMVGSTWALLGFAFFMKQREEFYPASFRQILYNQKFNKLSKKKKLSLARIELLKKNIEMIEKEIVQL